MSGRMCGDGRPRPSKASAARQLLVVTATLDSLQSDRHRPIVRSRKLSSASARAWNITASPRPMPYSEAVNGRTVNVLHCPEDGDVAIEVQNVPILV